MERLLPYLLPIALGFALAGTFNVMMARAVDPNDHMHPDGPAVNWYDPNCCSNADCRPVEDGTVADLKEGIKVGPEVWSYTDPRLRWSRDHRDHVCAPLYNAEIDWPKTRCVYRRFKGT